MKLIRAGFDGHADNSTLEISKLCRGILGDEVELLNGIRAGRVRHEVVGNLVIVHAIKKEIVSLLPVAIDVGLSRHIDAIRGSDGFAIGGYGSRSKQRQLHVVSAGQRQSHVCFRINDRAHFCGLRLQQGRFS